MNREKFNFVKLSFLFFFLFSFSINAVDYPDLKGVWSGTIEGFAQFKNSKTEKEHSWIPKISEGSSFRIGTTAEIKYQEDSIIRGTAWVNGKKKETTIKIKGVIGPKTKNILISTFDGSVIRVVSFSYDTAEFTFNKHIHDEVHIIAVGMFKKTGSITPTARSLRGEKILE
ncbi:MAG: hypothetical protein K9L78_01980 [Victivallales bacterium]|nr:hypothetical protein [Victivallales bacterium]MCF7888866.1 hypothetical protein [Victivallales bacterium]